MIVQASSSSSVLSNTHFPVLFSKHLSSDLRPCSDPGWRKSRSLRKRVCKLRAVVIAKKVAAVESSVSSSRLKQDEVVSDSDRFLRPGRKLKVLVAGGGIGGLVFALAAKKKGFDVVVFEKDLSAVRGEGQYRGPIQIQSNALAALEAIDMDVAEEVMNAGCVTGDRVNGLVDGISGTWYSKFDTFTPAVERGLPITRVISRMTLQQILAKAVGQDIILNSSNVVDFVDNGVKVTVKLENGQTFKGDVLVGADGIWSKVRQKLFGSRHAQYSGYTCYTGIADFVPPDIESVGYRVFLGHKQYFVSSDVGAGKIQWYAFHEEAPGGLDCPNGKKERLLSIFQGWCDNVVDTIDATEEEIILRRDIYDQSPSFTWGKGRVTMLGDAIHAMQPNMGQGGCMAIEDSYQLALELDKAWHLGVKTGSQIDVSASLKRYEKSRRLRVALIHGMARMAAVMASTYRAYLGVGLGPFSFLTRYEIPHPGIILGRVLFNHTMPGALNWVLGGYSSNLEGRPVCCRLADKASDQLQTWIKDDEALERTINGEWFLVPSGNVTKNKNLKPIHLSKAEDTPIIVEHASISFKDDIFCIRSLQTSRCTWITSKEGKRYSIRPDSHMQLHPSDNIDFGLENQVAYRVKVTRDPVRILRAKQEHAVSL